MMPIQLWVLPHSPCQLLPRPPEIKISDGSNENSIIWCSATEFSPKIVQHLPTTTCPLCSASLSFSTLLECSTTFLQTTTNYNQLDNLNCLNENLKVCLSLKVKVSLYLKRPASSYTSENESDCYLARQAASNRSESEAIVNLRGQ